MESNPTALNQSKCCGSNKGRGVQRRGAKPQAAVLEDKLWDIYSASSSKHVGKHIAGRANVVLGLLSLLSGSSNTQVTNICAKSQPGHARQQIGTPFPVNLS